MAALRNPRHESFCLGIIAQKSVINAFVDAGFVQSGTNDGNAFRLRNRPDVKARIAELQGAVAEEAVVSQADVLRELAKIGFSDIGDIFTDTGALKPVHLMNAATRGAVSAIKVKTSRVPGGEPADVEHTVEIKFWDKNSALEKVGKHLGMFTDKLALSNPDGSPLAAPQTDIELARLIAFTLTKAAKAAD